MAVPFTARAEGERPVPERVLKHLERMCETQPGMWNIAPSEGEYLSALVRTPLWPKAMGRSQVFKNNFLHPFNHLPLQPPGRPTIGPYTRSEES